jgi:hypothetical protein
MKTAQRLSLLPLRELFAALGASWGKGGRARVAAALARHAADPRLNAALTRAHTQAWQTVAILLAGESFWDGCKVFLSKDECRALRDQVRLLRDTMPLQGRAGKALRKLCGQELRRARQRGLLAEGAVQAEALAQALSQLPEGTEPDVPGARLVEELRQAEYPALANLLTPSRPGGPPVLLAALRLFLARELTAAPELLDELALQPSPTLQQGQAEALTMIADVMTTHGRGLQEWLTDEKPERSPDMPPAQAAGDGPPGSSPGPAPTRRPSLIGWLVVAAALAVPVVLVLWMVSGFAMHEALRFEGHKGPVLSLAFSPDGRRIFSGGSDTTVRMWDVETGKELLQFKGHQFGVSALAVSPDGKLLLSTDNQKVHLWDVQKGTSRRVLAMAAELVTGVAFPSLGPVEVSANFRDNRMEAWDVDQSRRLAQFGLDTRKVQNVTPSPDGKRALTAAESSVGLWDLEKGRQVQRLTGHKGLVVRAVFSPDGKLAASGGSDRTIRVWDLEGGKEVNTIKAGSVVVALAFDREGKRLLSGASARAGPVFEQDSPVVDSRPLRLWDARTGRDLALFDGPSGAVWAVAFSPDGRWALSGGEDAVIRLWPLPR